LNTQNSVALNIYINEKENTSYLGSIKLETISQIEGDVATDWNDKISTDSPRSGGLH
jgi:hypothetical protein